MRFQSSRRWPEQALVVAGVHRGSLLRDIGDHCGDLDPAGFQHAISKLDFTENAAENSGGFVASAGMMHASMSGWKPMSESSGSFVEHQY